MCEQRGHEYLNCCEDRAMKKKANTSEKLSGKAMYCKKAVAFCFFFLRTSFDHTLNVSISVAAHTPSDDDDRVPAPWLGIIQPVCEMLLPKLPTYSTASSSSCSFAFDMHTSPSVDPESRR